MLRENWHNGGRGLLVMVACAAVSILLLFGAWIGTTFLSSDEVFAPLSVTDVEINSRIPGIEGPATHVGEHYNGTLTICNDDESQQTITFVIQFERLTDDIHFVSGGSVEFPVEPGCVTLTGDSAPLPEDVTPGLWRESTAAIVQQGDQKQTVSFVSEPFEVVP